VSGLHGRRAVIAALLGTLAGCASPSPVLYTIAAKPGDVRSGAPKLIAVQEVGIARYLERSQIVRSSENYRLDVMSNEWWGEPLAALLTRVLVEELSQRLPGSNVLSESNTFATSPDATVAVTVQRMDEDASGHLVLQVEAGVGFGSRGAPVLQGLRLIQPLRSADVPGEVAAISVAVGQLADRLAATLATNPDLK